MYQRQLIEYLPENLREVKENRAILTLAEQPEMVSLWNAVDNAFKDQFIMDATENGVSRWEKILKISPKTTDNLESRRFTILTRVNAQLPFTLATLNEQLKSLCGEDNYEVKLDNENYKLSVHVAISVANSLGAVENLLKRTVPANMVIEVGFKYNRHEKYTTFTHEELKDYTHDRLRKEVEE